MPGPIAFAHLDVDLYKPTLHSLECIWPKLSPGGIILLDDYCDAKLYNNQNAFPSVKRASDEFL